VAVPDSNTVIHSDQGTQYGSDAWRRFCRSNHLEPSMSRKGNCWDSAVAEPFFSSLKRERIKKQIYKNRTLALNNVADYIDNFCNRTRRHSHLGGVSPEQYEAPVNRGDRLSTKSCELHLDRAVSSEIRPRLGFGTMRCGHRDRENSA
jgi:transposase InsO family protein